MVAKRMCYVDESHKTNIRPSHGIKRCFSPLKWSTIMTLNLIFTSAMSEVVVYFGGAQRHKFNSKRTNLSYNSKKAKPKTGPQIWREIYNFYISLANLDFLTIPLNCSCKQLVSITASTIKWIQDALMSNQRSFVVLFKCFMPIKLASKTVTFSY